MMLDIILVGYGQMGRMIEQIAPQHNLNVLAKIDPFLGNSIDQMDFSDNAVCLEFSTPESAAENLRKLIRKGQKIVCGTTGWLQDLSEISQLVIDYHAALVYGSNFSFGMNIFYRLVEEAAKKFNNLIEYDPYGFEVHHQRKKDSPSGTARILGDILLKNLDRKTEVCFEKLDRKIKPHEVHFASLRAGEVPGTHLIGFDSTADTIELKHTAHSRLGFALGAIIAAKWVADKKGIFEFGSVFDSVMV